MRALMPNLQSYKAINISKLMFGIKKTWNFLCDYLYSFYEFQGRIH